MCERGSGSKVPGTLGTSLSVTRRKNREVGACIKQHSSGMLGRTSDALRRTTRRRPTLRAVRGTIEGKRKERVRQTAGCTKSFPREPGVEDPTRRPPERAAPRNPGLFGGTNRSRFLSFIRGVGHSRGRRARGRSGSTRSSGLGLSRYQTRQNGHVEKNGSNLAERRARAPIWVRPEPGPV